jgi:hypothetical protein
VSHEQPSPRSWDRPRQRSSRRRSPGTWWTDTWRRFTDSFRRTWQFRPSIRTPELLDIHSPSEEFSFETPARGDAFTFRVRVRCSWTVQATAPEEEKKAKIAEIRKFIEQSRAVTRDRIEERVRPIARTFPPYRAAEAEKALNETISDCLNDGDVRVTVRTWVDVSDPVRVDLQAVWHERLVAVSASELDSTLKKAHVTMLGELQEEWRKLLVAGMVGIGDVEEAKTRWLAPYALALAEDPENAAGYLKDALEGRVGHAQQLLTDLGMIAIDDRAEAIEFAFQSESALLRLLMYLGVPVPARSEATVGGDASA